MQLSEKQERKIDLRIKRNLKDGTKDEYTAKSEEI